ncbi:hypothetical protein GZH47_05395 [Paenibacillus rhizovicinus]|uniref:Uncharacterized protein n=1 Tax=Paenibacillus rhizovicinus TaxID=2704463 RepID=A0A6C0NX83_9BACL|nr:hypothetical protein [Paenibacillus rhizovicinus]QHW30333.1 hypothetical protein GZH47_05395 [Paenibacillus rhizovicinus]
MKALTFILTFVLFSMILVGCSDGPEEQKNSLFNNYEISYGNPPVLLEVYFAGHIYKEDSSNISIKDLGTQLGYASDSLESLKTIPVFENKNDKNAILLKSSDIFLNYKLIEN